MTKNKPNKTVFAIINLALTEQQQLNVATYAAQLAKQLKYDVVLYPKNHNNNMVFGDKKRNFILATKIAFQIDRIATVRIAKKESTIFTPINEIAKQENAGFIVLEFDKTVKFLGESWWKTTEKAKIPIILLPKHYQFIPIKNITIAVDAERKIQKLKVVHTLAKAFDATVKIFVDNPVEVQQTVLIENILNYIKGTLLKHDISFKTTTMRKQDQYMKRLCKYAVKHSQALIIEVEQGKIDSVIEKNIQTLLNIQNYAKPIPIVLNKTKIVGKLTTFNG